MWALRANKHQQTSPNPTCILTSLLLQILFFGTPHCILFFTMSSHHNDHTHEHWDDHSHHHQRRRIAALPDLRFEQSYLRSVRPYVHVERVSTFDSEVSSKDEKGKTVAQPEDDTLHHEISSGTVIRKEEDIQIQWANVLWVTTKDQVLSPLIQGALWCVLHYCPY